MLTRPTKFGPYLLLERVSLGGMAEVFKAIEFGVEGFERTVAVKRILPHVAEDEEFITMFKDEARIAVQLQHANIAQIYHLGHEAESFYIALEYVGGRDLRAIFERCRKQLKTLPIPEICFIMMQVCEGLDYAHNKKDAAGTPLNIIHRDVSPPNILVSYEGSVKLCDFGVAKAAGRVSQTQAGILKGKFGYMSPEQVRGRSLDRRSDVFAAGVCLWELLTGKRLFHGDTDFSTLEKVRSGEVENPRSVVASIPEELEAIVMDALAAEPEDRIASAAELYERLRGFLLQVDRDFSRKDLANWMREQYASEIDEEKARDRSKRGDIERFKRGEFDELDAGESAPGGVPLPPLPNIPQVASGSVASSQGNAGPVMGGGGASRTSSTSGSGSVKRPPPKPRGRAKTLLNQQLPRPAAAQAPIPTAPPASTAPEKAPGRESMGWDDDELETRLFEDANSLSMLDIGNSRAGAGHSGAPEEPLARAMRMAKQAPPAGGLSPADSLGAPVAGKGSPAGHRPFRNAAASMTGSASASGSQMGEMEFHRSDQRKLWMVIGGVALVGAGLLFWGLGSGADKDEEPLPVKKVVPPSKAAPLPKSGLSIKVLPGDARISVAGRDICCGEERVAEDIPPGKHELVVDAGAGFFPSKSSVSVVEGKLTPVEINLTARRVQLDIRPDPARSGIFLVEDGQSRRIGRGPTRYELRRKSGQSYLIKVSAPGHESQEIPIPASAESSQRFDVMLAPRGSRASRVNSRTPSAASAAGAAGTPSRSAQLKIGAKLGLPPARVFVDGKEVGKTPINLDVTPGRHRIEWRWSDSRTTQSVTIDSGEAKTVFGSN